MRWVGDVGGQGGRASGDGRSCAEAGGTHEQHRPRAVRVERAPRAWHLDARERIAHAVEGGRAARRGLAPAASEEPDRQPTHRVERGRHEEALERRPGRVRRRHQGERRPLVGDGRPDGPAPCGVRERRARAERRATELAQPRVARARQHRPPPRPARSRPPPARHAPSLRQRREHRRSRRRPPRMRRARRRGESARPPRRRRRRSRRRPRPSPRPLRSGRRRPAHARPGRARSEPVLSCPSPALAGAPVARWNHTLDATERTSAAAVPTTTAAVASGLTPGARGRRCRRRSRRARLDLLADHALDDDVREHRADRHRRVADLERTRRAQRGVEL